MRALGLRQKLAFPADETTLTNFEGMWVEMVMDWNWGQNCVTVVGDDAWGNLRSVAIDGGGRESNFVSWICLMLFVDN